jgi:hypothetical protein
LPCDEQAERVEKTNRTTTRPRGLSVFMKQQAPWIEDRFEKVIDALFDRNRQARSSEMPAMPRVRCFRVDKKCLSHDVLIYNLEPHIQPESRRLRAHYLTLRACPKTFRRPEAEPSNNSGPSGRTTTQGARTRRSKRSRSSSERNAALSCRSRHRISDCPEGSLGRL